MALDPSLPTRIGWKQMVIAEHGDHIEIMKLAFEKRTYLVVDSTNTVCCTLANVLAVRHYA
jgi:hypothetical protein